MSHDIDFSTGNPAMAYVGVKPWHGLGEALPENQSIDEWVRAARLDWDIERLPVQYEFRDERFKVPERVVLVRSDTGAALSVVSSGYRVVQPRDVLEFYRNLVEKRQYTLETAGALDGGRKVWALANTGLVANVGKNPKDKLGAYVLLATSCDKSLATTATFTSIRVVCQNTLNFAISDMTSGSRRSLKVDHSQNFNVGQFQHDLGLMESSWDRFIESLNPMAEVSFTENEAQAYFEGLLMTEKEFESRKCPDRKTLDINELMNLYKSCPGQTEITAKDTLWGALNAVTYFVDHVRHGNTERMNSAWFGTGNVLKELAWSKAIKFVT